MADKVRIGVIGTGIIGKSHIKTYTDIPEVEIVAVADLREDEAQRVAQDYTIPSVYADYQQLLARTDIQAVDVCLHNRLHTPVTVDALKAGKDVYCEKPMSWCYRDAKVMADTARELGRKLHIQLSTIYAPECRAAKRLIESGALGQLYYAKACHYRRRGRPFVDGYATPAFVQRSAAGGGAMLDMAVYHISRMLYLLDNPQVLSVSGNTYQKVDNMYEDRRASSHYDVEELGMGLVRMGGGITFFMEEAWAIHADQPDGDHIYGTKGGVRVEPFSYFSTLADMEMDSTFDVKSADWRWHACDPTTAAYDQSQRHWVWALLGRVPLLDTAGIALNTALITEGVYLSANLQHEVTVSEIAQANTELYRS
ncbi:MAG: Gfo/Idh/MocA family protein [Anaerolineae bacterium]